MRNFIKIIFPTIIISMNGACNENEISRKLTGSDEKRSSDAPEATPKKQNGGEDNAEGKGRIPGPPGECTANKDALPAFPGAAGFGALSIGGRSETSKLLIVDNLNDSGDGSLRWALEQQGPRIIVFKVGGVIQLSSELKIDNPHVTVLGQTAPAPGITITGKMFVIATEEVILRYLRIRTNDSDPASDSLRINGRSAKVKNVILDHISVSWSQDEVVGIDTASNVTIQDSIISEPLNANDHAYALLLGNANDGISILGNFMAHATYRAVRVESGQAEYLNNIWYNFVSFGMVDLQEADDNPTKVNIIGNLIKFGPDSPGQLSLSVKNDVEVFVQGNITEGGEFAGNENISETNKFVMSSRRQLLPADKLASGVKKLGSSFPKSDEFDLKLFKDFSENSGSIISIVENPPKTGPATQHPYQDNDGDLMPDEYEKAAGLDAATDKDAVKFSSCGYLNIEEYANALLAAD